MDRGINRNELDDRKSTERERRERKVEINE
jgi:hypothetical protein